MTPQKANWELERECLDLGESSGGCWILKCVVWCGVVWCCGVASVWEVAQKWMCGRSGVERQVQAGQQFLFRSLAG